MKDDIQYKIRKLENSQIFNELFSFSVEIKNQGICREQKKVSGIINLTPKHPMLKIPIEVAVYGESQCVLFEDNQITKQESQIHKLKSSNYYQTEEDMIDKCLHSTAYMSEHFSQIQNVVIDKSHKEIFLIAKQQPLQKNYLNTQNCKLLTPQTQYTYQFNFPLPHNIPISIDQKVLPGVHLFVNYKIEASIQMDQKYLMCDNQLNKQICQNLQAKHTISKSFYIKKIQKSSQQVLTNKLIFKYFNVDGSLTSNDFIQNCCCMRYLYCKLMKKQLKYDIYHCQLLVNTNESNILHLTARIFLQPEKDKLDQCKVKKGKLYTDRKNQDSYVEQSDIPPQTKHETNNTGEKDALKINIQRILVKMYGQMDGIKKKLIFQEVIALNRQHWDMCQGELFKMMSNHYFSEKNELFQIKFWFQIQPMSQMTQHHDQYSKEEQANNQFQLTMGQLNQQNSQKNSNKRNKMNGMNDMKQKSKSIKQKILTKIEIITEQTNFLTL